MNASKRISLFGTGLLILSAGTLIAQEAGTRARVEKARPRRMRLRAQRPGQRGPGRQGARAGQETRILIGHAVSMAISGTTLKGQAEQAGRMDAPGQAGSQATRPRPGNGPGTGGRPGRPGPVGGGRRPLAAAHDARQQGDPGQPATAPGRRSRPGLGPAALHRGQQLYQHALRPLR